MGRERKLRSLPDLTLHSVRSQRLENGYLVQVGERQTLFECVGSEVGVWSVLTPSGSSLEATVERTDSELEVAIGQSRYRFALGAAPARGAARASASGRVEVRSPMPGKVVKVLVSAGQSVTAGEPVLLFEAMKMQNELRCPQNGVVTHISVEAGQTVEAREPLYVLDSLESR